MPPLKPSALMLVLRQPLSIPVHVLFQSLFSVAARRYSLCATIGSLIVVETSATAAAKASRCVEIRTPLSRYALGRVNFVSKMWTAGNEEEDDLGWRLWSNRLKLSEYPHSPQMAIKLRCKLKHEIERGLSKECG